MAFYEPVIGWSRARVTASDVAIYAYTSLNHSGTNLQAHWSLKYVVRHFAKYTLGFVSYCSNYRKTCLFVGITSQQNKKLAQYCTLAVRVFRDIS